MNMLKVMTVGSVLCSMVALGAEQEEIMENQEDGGVTASASVDILSHYVWRGTICNNNPVWQPSATLGYDAGDYGSLSANVWSSFDLTSRQGTSTYSRRDCGLQEIDYTLSYAVTLANLDWEVGHIWYSFPNNNGSSADEFYLTVSYANDYITPSFSVYWDYLGTMGSMTDSSGFYFTGALSHDFEVYEGVTLTPRVSLGFMTPAATGDATGNTELSDSTVGLTLSYAVTEWLSIGGQMNFTWIPSEGMRDSGWMYENRDTVFWGGFNATVSF